MTDPTRAEVERIATQLEQEEGCGLPQLAADMLRALRERAEAAERETAMSKPLYSRRMLEARLVELNAALTAARRAEAAAWNDAIEAAGNLESIHGYSNAVPRHRIRALRRAAPTEGEA